MKVKHNKKRNTAFVYEALIREATVSILKGDHEKKEKVISVIKKHITPSSLLRKDLECYRSLYENQNIDKWRWFQYQYTPSSTTQYLYVRINHPSITSSTEAGNAKIRLKAFAVRETLATFDLTDNMKGFRRRNVLVKLERLLQDILYNIEYLEDVINYDNNYMNSDEYHEWSLDLEFWQEKEWIRKN